MGWACGAIPNVQQIHVYFGKSCCRSVRRTQETNHPTTPNINVLLQLPQSPPAPIPQLPQPKIQIKQAYAGSIVAFKLFKEFWLGITGKVDISTQRRFIDLIGYLNYCYNMCIWKCNGYAKCLYCMWIQLNVCIWLKRNLFNSMNHHCTIVYRMFTVRKCFIHKKHLSNAFLASCTIHLLTEYALRNV